MRYRVKGFGIIRSENAAKPAVQKSRYVLDLIKKLPKVESTVDYGSGKLRYIDEISRTTDTWTLVDSKIQCERQQILFDQYTSVIQFLMSKNSCDVMNTLEFSSIRRKYGRAFLLNVIQIIPIPSIRIEVLRRLHRSLRADGELIACIQYRNSDFSRMAKMSNAFPFRDGIVIEHVRGTSFYAFISPNSFKALIEDAGFRVDHLSLNEGSCYIRAIKQGEH